MEGLCFSIWGPYETVSCSNDAFNRWIYGWDIDIFDISSNLD